MPCEIDPISAIDMHGSQFSCSSAVSCIFLGAHVLSEMNSGALEVRAHEFVRIPSNRVGPFHTGHQVAMFLRQEHTSSPSRLERV